MALAGRYTFIKILGSGAFGVTHLAFDNIRKENVAIKKIDLSKSQLKDVESEIENLKALSESPVCNKYIACLYDYFQISEQGSSAYYIVSEYIDGGDLYSYLGQKGGTFTPEQLWEIFYELVQGLLFIHQSGYAHRDIKLENVMINSSGQIKYIDFGFACVQACKVKYCMLCNGRVGTITYMPPEFFNSSHNSGLESAKRHDIWSLGILLYLLANNGLLPFDDLQNAQALMKVIQTAPKYPSAYKLDPEINLFVDSFLINNPAARPSILAQDYDLKNILLNKGLDFSGNNIIINSNSNNNSYIQLNSNNSSNLSSYKSANSSSRSYGNSPNISYNNSSRPPSLNFGSEFSNNSSRYPSRSSNNNNRKSGSKYVNNIEDSKSESRNYSSLNFGSEYLKEIRESSWDRYIGDDSSSSSPNRSRSSKVSIREPYIPSSPTRSRSVNLSIREPYVPSSPNRSRSVSLSTKKSPEFILKPYIPLSSNISRSTKLVPETCTPLLQNVSSEFVLKPYIPKYN